MNSQPFLLNDSFMSNKSLGKQTSVMPTKEVGSSFKTSMNDAEEEYNSPLEETKVADKQVREASKSEAKSTEDAQDLQAGKTTPDEAETTLAHEEYTEHADGGGVISDEQAILLQAAIEVEAIDVSEIEEVAPAIIVASHHEAIDSAIHTVGQPVKILSLGDIIWQEQAALASSPSAKAVSQPTISLVANPASTASAETTELVKNTNLLTALIPVSDLKASLGKTSTLVSASASTGALEVSQAALAETNPPSYNYLSRLTDSAKSLTPSTPAQLSVSTPFQQAQWGEAVAERVMWMSSKGIKQADIQMDPPELGPLSVKISVNQDQAQVSFTVQHSSVREALDQSALRLREMFAEEGLNLSDVDVSDQSHSQEQEASTDTGIDGEEASPQDVEDVAETSLKRSIEGYSIIDAYI